MVVTRQDGGVRQRGRCGRNAARRWSCANEAGVGRNAAKGDSPGQRPGNNAPPNQSSPERAKHGPLPRLMFRTRAAVFPRQCRDSCPPIYFASPVSRFFVARGREDLGGGLRYAITPFQGWIGLRALFPGRCPGLSHGAPLGRGGMCDHYAAFGAAPRVRTRQDGTDGPTGPALAATWQDGGVAPTRPVLAATRQGGGVRQWGRHWPQRGKMAGCANRPGVGRNAAKGDSPGQRPGNKAPQPTQP